LVLPVTITLPDIVPPDLSYLLFIIVFVLPVYILKSLILSNIELRFVDPEKIVPPDRLPCTLVFPFTITLPVTVPPDTSYLFKMLLVFVITDADSDNMLFVFPVIKDIVFAEYILNEFCDKNISVIRFEPIYSVFAVKLAV
jgi:hypothetical protein